MYMHSVTRYQCVDQSPGLHPIMSLTIWMPAATRPCVLFSEAVCTCLLATRRSFFKLLTVVCYP